MNRKTRTNECRNNQITNKVSDYELLCGDFNDDPYSMVHQYLIRKHWIDVAQFKEIEENMIAQTNFRL